MPNAFVPMLVTFFEMWTFQKALSRNALSPMLLMLSGIVTEVSFEQLENALSPILVTPLGIIIEVSFEQ